jgi:hypothetical protein
VSREVVETARAMVSGAVDLVAGSRELCRLRHDIDARHHELFLPIIGFESETDDYPIGSVRAQYGGAYLRRLDEEVGEYVLRAGPGVVAACERIIEALTARR